MAEVDKGLYAMADTVTETDRITGERSLSLVDREEQIKNANAQIEQVLAKLEVHNVPINENIDAAEYARLWQVFARIHAVSHFASEDWQVILLPDQTFNAWVNGGTYVMVYYGLLQQTETDDEIAAVIGHEMGHVAANHAFEGQAHRLAMRIADVGAAGKEGYAESFTNLQEQEADQIGILYAALAGFDPYAASRIWSRKAARSGSKWSYFHSHPVYNERAQQTKAPADAVNSYYTPGQQNQRHAELRTCNALWCQAQEQAQPGEGAGFAAILGAGLNAYLAHMEADVERDRQKEQIKRQHAHPSSQVAVPAMAPPPCIRWLRLPRILHPPRQRCPPFGGHALQQDRHRHHGWTILVPRPSWCPRRSARICWPRTERGSGVRLAGSRRHRCARRNLRSGRAKLHRRVG